MPVTDLGLLPPDFEEATVQMSVRDLREAVQRERGAASALPSAHSVEHEARHSTAPPVDSRRHTPKIEANAATTLRSSENSEPSSNLSATRPYQTEGSPPDPFLTSNFPRKKTGMVWLAVVAVASVVAGLGYLFFGTQETTTKPAQVVGVIASAPPPEVKPTNVCTPTGSPQRIAERYQPNVSVNVRSLPGGSHVAVGFSGTSRIGLGVRLAVPELSVEHLSRQDSESPLLGVTPTLGSGELKFVATRTASALKSGVPLDLERPVTFGIYRNSYAVAEAKNYVELWKSESNTMTVPQVRPWKGHGALLAFRAGGERGKLLLGRISGAAEPKGALHQVKVPASHVGAPALDTDDSRIWLAVKAGKTPEKEGLYVGLTEYPYLPSTLKALPELSSPLVETPTIVGLGKDYAVLIWSRSSPEARAVLAQVYNLKTMQSAGEQVAVSEVGQDASQAVSARLPGGLAVMYAVKREQHYELWSRLIDCN